MKVDRITVIGPNSDNDLGNGRLSIEDTYATVKIPQAISVKPTGWPIVVSQETDTGVDVVYSGKISRTNKSGSMAGLCTKLKCKPPKKYTGPPAVNAPP